MSKIKIKWNDSGRAFGGFCVISDDNEQSGKFSSCKDYIQDLYTYYFNKANFKAHYAFITFGYEAKASKKNIKVAYGTYAGSKFSIAKALDYIHQVEEALRFSTLSKIEKSNRRNTFIAVGSNKWLLSPPMISFYTFLLRTANQHVIGRDFMETFEGISGGIDQSSAKKLASGLMAKMIEIGVKKIFSGRKIKNYPSTMNTHNIGIYGFSHQLSIEQNVGVCKHWYSGGWYDDIDWTSD